MDCCESCPCVEGRPEMRDFIRFVFEVFMLFVAASVSLAISEALWAISEYTVANPGVWFD